VVVSPCSDNVVEALDEGNPTNQEGQNAEGQAAEKRDRQRECQQETGRDRPVEAPDDEPSQAGVGPHRLPGRARDFHGRLRRRGA